MLNERMRRDRPKKKHPSRERKREHFWFRGSTKNNVRLYASAKRIKNRSQKIWFWFDYVRDSFSSIRTHFINCPNNQVNDSCAALFEWKWCTSVCANSSLTFSELKIINILRWVISWKRPTEQIKITPKCISRKPRATSENKLRTSFWRQLHLARPHWYRQKQKITTHLSAKTETETTKTKVNAALFEL